MSRIRAIAIIPARLGSTRFPEKVLASETGKPLVRHVWERVQLASTVARTIIATDDQRVIDVATDFGAESVLTSPEHSNGSSRLAEAARLVGLADSDVVVNVQGDEPEIDPTVIDCATRALVESDAHVATVASPFGPREDPANPNIVKVVRRLDGMALYFSRALMPHARDPDEGRATMPPLKHVGLYAYRVRVLAHYAKLPPSPLERTEKLEQLRFLEHGFRVAVSIQETHHHGIDTPEQYRAFVERHRAAAATD